MTRVSGRFARKHLLSPCCDNGKMLFKVLKKQKYSWTLGVQSSINSLCGVLTWSELSSCDWNRGHTLSTATRQVRMLSNPKAEAVPQTHGLYLDTVFLWVADNNVVSEAAILNGVWACSWQEAGTVRVLWCHSFYHLILSAGAHSIGSTAFLTNRKNSARIASQIVTAVIHPAQQA